MNNISNSQFGGSNPHAVTNGVTGQPIQKLSKATLNSNYQTQRSAFKERRATAKQMASTLTPTKLMQNSGRSPSFIAANTPKTGGY